MKPSELAMLLAQTIPGRIPVCITGAPGIGKTDIVSQACDQTGADLIVAHPAVEDPTDSKGMPWIENGRADFVPFGETLRVLQSTKPTVWFWDDLGQASPAVQASRMPWLLARRIGSHVLPDHVTIIAATNRRVDRAGVSGVLEPVKSRFGCIVELEPDLNESCIYACDRGWRPEIPAFWRFEPDLLSKFQPTADLTNSPSPRTWSNVNRLLTLDLPSHVRSAAIAGAIGEGAASHFMGFLSLWSTLPSVDQILIDPDSVDVPQGTSTLYAVSSALAHRATAQNFGRLCKFLDKMIAAGSGEFAVLALRDSWRRCPATKQTQASNRMITGPLSNLIS